MKSIPNITILLIMFVLMMSLVSAFSFDVPEEIKSRAEEITLQRYEEQQVGDLTLKYELIQSSHVQFFVKRADTEWQAFDAVYGGVANQFVPAWTNEIVLHIEKIGAEGTEDLNYVSDPSEITLWVEDNQNFIHSCGDFIEDPKNIGLQTGNFYSSEKDTIRHWFLKSFTSTETYFSYSFDINPSEGIFRLNIYDREDFNNPVDSIIFAPCGDTTFFYRGKEFLIQPFYYMENGNWDVAIREITRLCPREELTEETTIISIGLYDDLRQPIDNFWIQNAERLGGSSAKIDIKEGEGSWNTFVFDDCEWKTIGDDFSIKLAGMYGREAEFYVFTDDPEHSFQAPDTYSPFWDRILAILRFY